MTPELARLVEALEAIATDDELVHASGGAWTLQAYERRRDIARAALVAVAQAGAEPHTGTILSCPLCSEDASDWIDQRIIGHLIQHGDSLTAKLTDARAAIRLAKDMLDEVDDSTLAHLWPERIDNWKALPAVQAALEKKR